MSILNIFHSPVKRKTLTDSEKKEKDKLLMHNSVKNMEISSEDEAALRTAVKAGSLMISAGAETYRSEDTMKNILNIVHPDNEVYVMGTGLAASLNTCSNLPVTMVKRVKNRGINLNIIDSVNQISRDLHSGNINFAQADVLLNKVHLSYYKPYLKIICTIAMTAAFSLLLSGNFIDASGGMIDGLLLVIVNWFAEKYKFRPFITNIIAGFCLSVGAILICNYLLPSANQDMIIAGSLMLLFPGTAFTASIRDTIHGDYVSGLTRAMEAILIAISLALGVGLGLSILGGFL